MWSKSIPSARVVAFYFCEKPFDNLEYTDLKIKHLNNDVEDNRAVNL